MKRRIIKRGITGWLIFHGLVMLLVPNQFSFLNQMWEAVLFPYANLLGLHSQWDFFAPDPGTPITLEIKLHTNLGIQTAAFPDPTENIFRPQLNRRIAVARLVPKRNHLLGEVFLPWFCRKYPDANSIYVTAKAGVLPSLLDVNRGMALNDLSRKSLVAEDHLVCPREGGRK